MVDFTTGMPRNAEKPVSANRAVNRFHQHGTEADHRAPSGNLAARLH